MTIFQWRPAALLQVSGTDAANFLQGQFTNDLRAAKTDTAVYGLWLSLKGKVQADSFVGTRPDGSFWICSYHCPAATLRERLESYVIADDVTIEDQTPTWSGLTLIGDEREWPSAAAVPVGMRFAGRRTRAPHQEWLFPTAEAVVAQTSVAGAAEVTAGEMERWRIEAALPAIPEDVGPNDLPNEGGLEADAISYTKGCYLGQEVMARLKSMGQVRRRLLPVRGKAVRPATLPAPLYLGEKQVGELRSAVSTDAGLIGLAMLSLLPLRAESRLALAPGADQVLEITQWP
jgi:folate-binding protein YgfZ